MSDISMPSEIVDFINQRNWGDHHLHWHVVRIWDLLPSETIQWAISQGWKRYDIQEGEESNGLEFLAMHRVMIRTLVNAFPEHTSLFDGWVIVPTDPMDSEDPLPNRDSTPFNSDMNDALDRMIDNIDSFDGEDLFGTYIETSLRPFPNDVSRRTVDSTSGIHNYIHGRFQDDNSPINMGDPSVNIENQRFWKLHGWIESRWEEYRQTSGRSNNEPRYLKALADAERHMGIPIVDGFQPFIAAPWHEGVEIHPRLEIPEEIKASILDALYFCDIE